MCLNALIAMLELMINSTKGMTIMYSDTWQSISMTVRWTAAAFSPVTFARQRERSAVR